MLIDLTYHTDQTGGLCAIEGGIDAPFDILRVFTVSALKGSIRGEHAHKKCSQFMVCVSGAIEVTCDNGIEETTYQLDSPSAGLNVKPGIWAREKYLTENGSFVKSTEQPLFVRIEKFSDSSIDLLVYCFATTTNWGEWLEIKENLAFEIKGIVEKNDAGFAFPSQSIYIEKGST